MQQHLFQHFQSRGHTGFVEDVFINFICPFIPINMNIIADKHQQPWLHLALISRKMLCCSGYNCCFVQIILDIFDARQPVLGLRFQELILIVEVNSELCPLFQAERFAEPVNDSGLQSVLYYAIAGVLILPLLIVIYQFFVVIYYYYCHTFQSSVTCSNSPQFLQCNTLLSSVMMLLC